MFIFIISKFDTIFVFAQSNKILAMLIFYHILTCNEFFRLELNLNDLRQGIFPVFRNLRQ